MYLIAIKPKNRGTVEFEIAYRGGIVDVVLEHGEIRTENEEIRQFVIKEVLPYLPHWIGWKNWKKKGGRKND